MNEHDKKAETFINKLMANPAITDFYPLQREGQIVQFLQINSSQLCPTLASESYFPRETWPQILSRLLSALFAATDREMIPALERLVLDGLDLGFIAFLKPNLRVDPEGKAKLFAFVSGMLKKPEARRELSGSFSAIQSGIVDRYIDEIFARKEYPHFELTKVQRLRMSKEEIRNYVKVSVLLKPIVLLYSAAGGQGNQSGLIQVPFAEKLLASAKEQLPFLPEEVLHSAVFSSVSSVDNRYIEATARISGVLTALGRQYRRNMRVDRGADTQEKSWFSIARRNFRFFGFDVKLIDEFYKTAAENGW